MKKKLFIGFLIILLLMVAAGVYLDKVYLPNVAKSLIIKAIEDNTGSKATLGGIRLNILKGVVLENFSISDKETGELFLKVERISCGWLILPLFKKGQLIVPLVNVYAPEINLKRRVDKTFNFLVLKHNTKNKEAGKFSLIIYKLNIQGARINFIDQAVTPVYEQKSLLDIELALSLPQGIKLKAVGQLHNRDSSTIDIVLSGALDLATKNCSAAFDFANFNLTDISVYYKEAPFTLKKTVLERLKGDAVFNDGKLKASFMASLPEFGIEIDKEGLSISGAAILDGKLDFAAGLLGISLKNSEAKRVVIKKEAMSFSGEVKKLTGEFSYNTATGFLDYSGWVSLSQANLSGIAYIKQIEDLSGEVTFSKDKLRVANLTAKGIGALFNLSGEVGDFTNPTLNLKISSERVYLEKLQALLAEAKLAKMPFAMEGPAKLDLGINISASNPEGAQIKGQVILENNKLVLSKPKQELNEVSGTLIFSKDKIEALNLNAAAFGGRLNAKGVISDFSDPKLSLTLGSDVISLEKLMLFIAENKLADLPVAPRGNIGLKLILNMRVLNPESIEIKGEALLKDDQLSISGLKQKINNISGKVSFDNNSVEWEDAAAEFNGKKYNSSGKAKDFQNPAADFILSSDELSINSVLEVKDKTLEIKRLKGKYLNSAFDITAKANLGESSPRLNIESELAINIKDFKKLMNDYLPAYSALLAAVNPDGLCNIKLSASGPINNAPAMNIALNLSSKNIHAYGMKFDNLELSFTQKDKIVPLMDLQCESYGGKIKLSGNADLGQAQPKFNLNLGAVNINLAELKQDTTLKDKTLSGLLSADLALTGSGFNVDNLLGKGLLTIKEGNLWEFAPLKKLALFLFIPSFEKIIFNEAEVDLIIQEGNIYSDQIMLKSQQVNLYANGKMDFKGNLDYMVRSEFTSEIMKDSSELKDILASVLGKIKGGLSTVLDTASQIVTIKITGTITRPKPEFAPIIFEPLKQLKKIFE